MRQIRYRALITLDTAPQDAKPYRNLTHALMVRARCLQRPAYSKYFPSEISWDDERPLRAGDHAVVTITMIDDEASQFFAPGQHFTIWNGSDVGHGVISRRVFTAHGPC